MKKNIIALSVLVSSLVLSSMTACAENNHSGSAEESAITAKVKMEIAKDPHLSMFKVDVSTIHDDDKTIVILSGDVGSYIDRNLLVSLAKNNQGVDKVDAKAVKIKESKHAFDDAAITTKVKAVFAKEGLEGFGAPITVETVNGVVHLQGYLSSQSEIDQAKQLAKTIKGVKKVEARLEVRQ